MGAASVFGLIITPMLIATDPDPRITDEQREADLLDYAQNVTAEDVDLFADLAGLEGVAALDDGAMSVASGGSATAIDIANLGANAAENMGTVDNINVSNTNNGEIANNVVSDNGGITTVFNNTGNGVVMNSIVNLNIFLQGGGPTP
ncbi:hypothetical protein ABFZ85_01150 [Hyphococcus formosus]|uniref:hypothetical protein n=1 Tax=Hyphococcus formosus TaxID=3143534 RepID=UPI00398B1BA8